MDSFNLLLKEVMQKPSIDGLRMVCSNLEAWEIYMPSTVKEKTKRALTAFLADGSLVCEDDMLRLYRLLGKYSKNLGAVNVFEKVEEQGRFEHSLKFHLMWAETYAQSGDLKGFTKVLSLARHRLQDIPIVELEGHFRDLADQYFPNTEIFARRRSSLANLQHNTADARGPFAGANFGANKRVMIRNELVDRPSDSYIAPSLEEARATMIADIQMLDECYDAPMDVTVEPVVKVTPSCELSEKKEFPKRNRVLETVEECDLEISNEEKRRRLLSPAQPTRCAVFTASAQKSHPETTVPSASTHTAATFITGSSFAEKAYNDMKAMFSDTVDINQDNLRGITDETTLPIATPVIEPFEVFVDEESAIRGSEAKDIENVSSQHTFTLSRGERTPFQTMHVDNMGGDVRGLADSDIQKNSQGSGFGDVRRTNSTLLSEDEETMAGAKFTTLGIDKKPDRGIVTSTPAHQTLKAPTHEDFFAPLNKQLEEQMRKEEDEEVLYAQSALMRRHSLAPPKSTGATKQSLPKVRPLLDAERAMEMALNKMNLEEPEDEMKMGIAECGDVIRTAVECPILAGTGRINPWDRQLRMAILKKYPKPYFQHEFDMVSPRVSVGEMADLGGETFKIVALIGEGGFAKVFKTTNEEGLTLALKYEVPPCPWEVYICSELRVRLDKATKFTLDSLMQVTEAYMFSNASVIFSEYHPFGTLLDLSNKMKDPNWYIVLLIAIQMAKILRDVHNAKIIHGDIKPDNFMVLNELNYANDPQKILSTPILRLIDWGRAIDMHNLSGRTFSGKIGTEKFNCSEMLDGRPWTYQTDYFGFVGTMHVMIFNKYANVVKKDGVVRLESVMKRRLVVRPLLEKIFHDFLNIPDCDHFPSWDGVIKMATSLDSRYGPNVRRYALKNTTTMDDSYVREKRMETMLGPVLSLKMARPVSQLMHNWLSCDSFNTKNAQPVWTGIVSPLGHYNSQLTKLGNCVDKVNPRSLRENAQKNLQSMT
ncbi:hypothetical protein KIN20_006567 [Parelaphostrongylus tenuis]|uniref:Protein kinase domain-containing protein n=1 Tax=Parelaphostrongylus tenuis TaxID=148309 RepID=A0AAD5M6A0_PARTN|nr:hypothetical protein KIN20_006567 [Parelaphostrongylus tenuis]